MKTSIILIIFLLTFNHQLNGQNRIIHGRILSEYLEPLYGVRIQSTDDTTLFGETKSDGRFTIQIPQKIQGLMFNWIGFEETNIRLNENCDTIEVIMMYAGTYDFMSSKKIDKLRIQRFKKIPGLHVEAFKKGLFTKDTICYGREFHPDKPELDKIGKEIDEEKKQNKKTFYSLKIGDTIKIPFSTEYNADGTNRTTLLVYSFVAYKTKYECIIEAVITGKNRHKRGYNLICKITSCNLCVPETFYNNKIMKPGEVFVHNMKYFKILTR